MTQVQQLQPIIAASHSVVDCVMARLVAGLSHEFGHEAGRALAARFLAAEECDFLWEARRCERWLGTWEGEIEDDIELDRVAICGRLDGRWFVAVSIVDGDGRAHGLIGRRDFDSEQAAREAFVEAR